jgi:hypothetical protein
VRLGADLPRRAAPYYRAAVAPAVDAAMAAIEIEGLGRAAARFA